jgi:hypothetical protein
MLGIDGNAIDMAAMLCGVLAMCVRPYRLRHWTREEAITDFLNGTSVVPFVTMAASVWWTSLRPLVLESGLSLGLAGAVGAILVVADIATAGKSSKA